MIPLFLKWTSSVPMEEGHINNKAGLVQLEDKLGDRHPLFAWCEVAIIQGQFTVYLFIKQKNNIIIYQMQSLMPCKRRYKLDPQSKSTRLFTK